MDTKKVSRIALLLALAIVAPAGQAHTLSAEHAGVLSGLIHPWLGLDHALAMLAVGLWARQQGSEHVLRLPLAFVLFMVSGVAMAGFGLPLPALAAGLASSLLVLGLLLLFALRLPATAGTALVAVFALLHGYDHGTRLPGSGPDLAYVLGLATASACLHACGVVMGGALTALRAGLPLRLTGAAVAASGILLWA